MGEAFFKSFIVASIVYVTYHLLGFIPFFSAGAMFEISSMLIYFYVLPFFALGNAVTYLMIKKRINQWNIPFNFFSLFVIANFIFGNIPLDDTVIIGEPPFSNDFLYWNRWILAMVPLFSLNYIYKRLTTLQKYVFVFSPVIFITFIVLSLICGT